jgi:hypothetical protein
MKEYPGFGTLLRRLAARRSMDLRALPDISDEELQAMLDGRGPSVPLLQRLAPALRLHAEDLVAMAQIAIPDELAPLDPDAGLEVPRLVGLAMRLSPELMRSLREHVQSLPRQHREGAVATPQAHEQYAPGVGAVLMQLLANRNLKWTSSAKVLSRLAGVHLAASTIGAIGHGSKELTIDLLPAFATVLGIEIEDLAALVAIEPQDLPPTQIPAAAVDIAKLIWDVRRLTADQMLHVGAHAESMLIGQ